MKELLHCRAMESMCRQRASFYPEEAWKFMAEAEMWRHRAMDLATAYHHECNQQIDVRMTGQSAQLAG